MKSHNRKELTMKRLTATLATVTLVIAIGAPIASGKPQAAKAAQKAPLKHRAHPGQKPVAHGIQVRVAKRMLPSNF
jgi:preprotein translocase subunit SecG